MNTYRIASTPMFHTPGVVLYLRSMALTDHARAREVMHLMSAQLSDMAVTRLLTGDYTVEGEDVVVQG